jgi:hypothetical protein
MKKEKLSLNGIKNVLSRKEMKKIMAGSGIYACCQCFWDGGIYNVILANTINPNENCGQFCASKGYQDGGTLPLYYCNY